MYGGDNDAAIILSNGACGSMVMRFIKTNQGSSAAEAVKAIAGSELAHSEPDVWGALKGLELQGLVTTDSPCLQLTDKGSREIEKYPN